MMSERLDGTEPATSHIFDGLAAVMRVKSTSNEAKCTRSVDWDIPIPQWIPGNCNVYLPRGIPLSWEGSLDGRMQGHPEHQEPQIRPNSCISKGYQGHTI